MLLMSPRGRVGWSRKRQVSAVRRTHLRIMPASSANLRTALSGFQSHYTHSHRNHGPRRSI
ncbi:hypothetical protein GA0070608_4113 [Micromonospora peucetia]|uniref:Uncharacterized protein n=1 Tax=Micromonospora peucetia TaxID=47871 RepID=A0A1C6VUF8_9ACTN|nr:hypothetical protein GA0070608_4113 [Micromonospora peucetia]